MIVPSGPQRFSARLQRIKPLEHCLHTQGKLTAPRSMLAGLGAGMMEAIIAVTPSETIK